MYDLAVVGFKRRYEQALHETVEKAQTPGDRKPRLTKQVPRWGTADLLRFQGLGEDGYPLTEDGAANDEAAADALAEELAAALAAGEVPDWL